VSSEVSIIGHFLLSVTEAKAAVKVPPVYRQSFSERKVPVKPSSSSLAVLPEARKCHRVRHSFILDWNVSNVLIRTTPSTRNRFSILLLNLLVMFGDLLVRKLSRNSLRGAAEYVCRATRDQIQVMARFRENPIFRPTAGNTSQSSNRLHSNLDTSDRPSLDKPRMASCQIPFSRVREDVLHITGPVRSSAQGQERS